MKKEEIGYIYSEMDLGKDEKIFLKEAEKRNIELKMININEDFEEKGILEKVENCKIVYNSSAENFAQEFVKMIESFGKKVVDSSKTYYFVEDKWIFYVSCKENKIPVPDTILLSENLNIAKISNQ